MTRLMHGLRNLKRGIVIEQTEGRAIEPRERIDTATGNTEGTISLQIQNHEDDFGRFGTWDDFAIYMKETYGSADTTYTRFI